MKKFRDEKEFRRELKKKAEELGWMAHFTPDASFSKTAGFPDMVMVRERIMFAELKVKYNKISDAQAAWINRLNEIAEREQIEHNVRERLNFFQLPDEKKEFINRILHIILNQVYPVPIDVRIWHESEWDDILEELK